MSPAQPKHAFSIHECQRTQTWAVAVGNLQLNKAQQAHTWHTQPRHVEHGRQRADAWHARQAGHERGARVCGQLEAAMLVWSHNTPTVSPKLIRM